MSIPRNACGKAMMHKFSTWARGWWVQSWRKRSSPHGSNPNLKPDNRCRKFCACVNWRNSAGELTVWIDRDEQERSNFVWQQLEDEQDGERSARLYEAPSGTTEQN